MTRCCSRDDGGHYYPDAQQVKVPRGNHFPMCDNPELVASTLTDFAAKPDH